MHLFTTQLRPALVALVVFTLITGVVYPLMITGMAQILFPVQANGSLINEGNTVRGSDLIGQDFSDPAYFWGRLSATNRFPYNAAESSGSNYGPSSDLLLEQAQARITALRTLDPSNNQSIPIDLVTASGSGLDPHISPAAANYQAPRVATARNLTLDQVQELIALHTEDRFLGVFGEPRVNVLRLNLALDSLQ